MTSIDELKSSQMACVVIPEAKDKLSFNEAAQELARYTELLNKQFQHAANYDRELFVAAAQTRIKGIKILLELVEVYVSEVNDPASFKGFELKDTNEPV